MSPPKGTQPQNHVDITEQSSGNQTGNEPVSVLSCSKDSSIDTQNAEQHVVTTPNRDVTTSPLTTATPIIIPRKAGYCNHLRVSVCLFVCLFVSRISHKLQVGF